MGSTDGVSAAFPYTSQYCEVHGSRMHYVEQGTGRPVLFLHGNPTSCYLWRNIIPHVSGLGRAIAPDLIGMGGSDKPRISYQFVDHARYLDGFIEALALDELVLVVHDWGSALGFHYAQRFPERVRAVAYMEAIVQPLTWDDWPADARPIFQAMRSAAGETIVIERNKFIEAILPASVLRKLSEAEMTAYRAPFLDPSTRKPMLVWPREIPIDGEPADVVALVARYAEFMSKSPLPKLFINADPGVILIGRQREFCRTWPNQREVTVRGSHFLQEDSPHEIGTALAEFVQSLAN